MAKGRNRERGGSRLKLIIALAVTAGIGISLVRIVPVYVKAYEFQDAVWQEARFAVVRNQPPPEIRARLFQKAQELGLPMRIEQIQVTPAGRGGVRIFVSYTVPVQLPGYTFTLNFQDSADTASAY